MVKRLIQEKDIKSFRYDGDDTMIMRKDTGGTLSLEIGGKGVQRIPPVHPKFKASLVLKSGETIDAPPAWRKRIWTWWYDARFDELLEVADNVLCQAAADMLGANYPGGKYPRTGNLLRRCEQ
jgi:hypothetical protein